MSDYEYLEIERKGKVVTCRMSNPPTHTLVAAEMAELTHFVDSLLEDEQARVVVFTGGGEGVFIAHYEVGELADTAEAQTAPAAVPGKELHGFHRLLLRMQAAPFVTVAATIARMVLRTPSSVAVSGSNPRSRRRWTAS